MKILIAEDDPLTRESLVLSLKREGFDVTAVANGNDALTAWRTERPDLLCLDIMMPEKDGFSVCREVRREDANVPIIFLSAKNEEIDVVVGLELGAHDFIRKPFGKRELLARIQGTLRRHHKRQTEPIHTFSMGRWVIFPKELRAEAAGESVALTPREISLLTTLFERQGEVVSRDELLDECWGVEYFPESRTLDQHISKLRRKLNDEGGARGLIQTVRGAGYRFPR